MIWPSLEIDWRNFTAIERASTAFGSTINGGSAFSGETEMLTMLKSLTITRSGR